MKRLLAWGGLLAATLLVSNVYAADKADKEGKEEKAAAKAALQALNDYIGEWKGNGGPLKTNPPAKDLWSETLTWGWKFKGDDAWLTLDFKNGKYYKSGELHYSPEKMKYELTLIDKADQEQVFEGELKDDILSFEREDPKTKEATQIRMNLAAEGIRLIYRVAHRPEGRKLFVNDYQVACNKAGESLASAGKKTLCIVSGGLGTIPVAYNGTTYYVCCSGCKEAFLENPEKYIKEFEAKKTGKK